MYHAFALEELFKLLKIPHIDLAQPCGRVPVRRPYNTGLPFLRQRRYIHARLNTPTVCISTSHSRKLNIPKCIRWCLMASVFDKYELVRVSADLDGDGNIQLTTCSER